MRAIEWTSSSLRDLAALDRSIAFRVKQAIERFAASGAGDIRKLQGVHQPEFRLRIGDYRVRFHYKEEVVRILRIRNRREAYR